MAPPEVRVHNTPLPRQTSFRPPGASCIATTQDACCIPRRTSCRAAVVDTQCTPCFTTEALDCVSEYPDAAHERPSRGFARLHERASACIACGPHIVPIVVLDMWLVVSYPARLCMAAAMVCCNDEAGVPTERRP